MADDTIASGCITSLTEIRDIVATMMGTGCDKVYAILEQVCNGLTVFERTKRALCKRAPLHFPIQNGDLAVVRRLVCYHSADVNRPLRNSNDVPIELAARYGQLDVVKFLVEHGANIDFPEKKFTPLHAAAYNGHIDVMKYLVSIGAQIDSEDEKWVTPLHPRSL